MRIIMPDRERLEVAEPATWESALSTEILTPRKWASHACFRCDAVHMIPLLHLHDCIPPERKAGGGAMGQCRAVGARYACAQCRRENIAQGTQEGFYELHDRNKFDRRASRIIFRVMQDLAAYRLQHVLGGMKNLKSLSLDEYNHTDLFVVAGESLLPMGSCDDGMSRPPLAGERLRLDGWE